jgi:hypothetical protein
MLHENHYVIRPQQALLERAVGLGVEIDGWLAESQVLRNQEAGRSAWRPGDHVLRVKMSFLMWFVSEFGSTGDYHRVFPDGITGKEDFDRWWEVEEVDLFDTSDVKKPPLAKMRPTGNELVDEWLRGLS